MDSGSQSTNSEQSLKKRNELSDSECSDHAMDDRPDSVQDGVSHTESLDSSISSKHGAEPCEHMTGAVRDKATDGEEAEGSKEASSSPGESVNDTPHSSRDQIVKTAPDTPTQRPVEETKSVMSRSGTGQKSKAANNNTVKKREPVLDHNANEESNEKQKANTNQKRKNESKQKTTEQNMVFGFQTPSQVTLINSHEASTCRKV